MSTDPNDYTLPEGELNEDWFPDIDLMAFLNERVSEAYARQDVQSLSTQREQDDAAVAFVYMKAYQHVYRRKADDPSQWTAEGQGSEQQSDRQVQRWKEMAEEKESLFYAKVRSSDPDQKHPGTQTVPNRSTYV